MNISLKSTGGTHLHYWKLYRLNEMLKGCIELNRIMNPIVASLLEFNEALKFQIGNSRIEMN